eukprot:CAMPEP_0184704566 /NCGR_PEP_ID=MMETSP0313-20130426/31589_1 /TAXON_ID=2792 /ORGANISM="Porphyridium aerugineum, Strain SAG 1380-2" /LENGTH=131 /DNA_ID=CAMNT_0027165647 /DNA_START=199 /DNA_END=591 /DNA_ORIENTATION=+
MRNSVVARNTQTNIRPNDFGYSNVTSSEEAVSKNSSVASSVQFDVRRTSAKSLHRTNSISNGQIYFNHLVDLTEQESSSDNAAARMNSCPRTRSSLLEQKFHVLDDYSAIRSHPSRIRSTDFRPGLAAIPE